MISVVCFPLSVLTIFVFSMYQIFLTKKCEYQNRLLNVLYFHLATFLNIGVVLNVARLAFILLELQDSQNVQIAFSILKFFQTFSGLLLAALIGKYSKSSDVSDGENVFPAIVSLIRNFKMSLYLKLSTKILGKWVVMMVVALSSTICLVSSTYCYLAGDWKKCFKNNFLRVCQSVLVPTFACCLVILSDLTTIKLKKKISELRAESQTAMSREVAVIQMNNFLPSQQGPDCCSTRDHVRSISTSSRLVTNSLLSMSTGFLTLLLNVTVAGIATFLLEPIWSWQLDVLLITSQFVTAAIWIGRGKDLREFTSQTVKRIIKI